MTQVERSVATFEPLGLLERAAKNVEKLYPHSALCVRTAAKTLKEESELLKAEVARLEADNAGLRGMARELVGSL